MDVAGYYDWLSRYHTLVAAFGYRGSFDANTVHRLLVPDRPGVLPADVVHDRLLTALGHRHNPRVIDAGCGRGGTVFYLQARLGGTYNGLTLSRVQHARAVKEADRREVSAACRFHVRNYDDDFESIAPDGADVVVAIESLAHSTDPAETIANLARVLRPGGLLAIVDDVPRVRLAANDHDYVEFRAGWACPAIANDDRLTVAIAGAGLSLEHEEDLTPLVSLRPIDSLERLVRLNRPWRRLLGRTSAGALVNSLYGGLMLERLYRRGEIRYRFMVARM